MFLKGYYGFGLRRDRRESRNGSEEIGGNGSDLSD